MMRPAAPLLATTFLAATTFLVPSGLSAQAEPGRATGAATLTLRARAFDRDVTTDKPLAVDGGQLVVHDLGQRFAGVTLIASGGRQVPLAAPPHLQVGLGRPVTLEVPAGTYVGVVLTLDQRPRVGVAPLEGRATYRATNGNRATWRLRVQDRDSRGSLIKELDRPLVVREKTAVTIDLEATLDHTPGATGDLPFDGWRSTLAIASAR